jgi:hypothetical protein
LACFSSAPILHSYRLARKLPAGGLIIGDLKVDFHSSQENNTSPQKATTLTSDLDVLTFLITYNFVSIDWFEELYTIVIHITGALLITFSNSSFLSGFCITNPGVTILEK